MYENTGIKRPLKVDFMFKTFWPIENLGLIKKNSRLKCHKLYNKFYLKIFLRI